MWAVVFLVETKEPTAPILDIWNMVRTRDLRYYSCFYQKILVYIDFSEIVKGKRYLSSVLCKKLSNIESFFIFVLKKIEE